MDIEKTITKYALQNAIKFNGRANPNAVLGKVLSEQPSLKSNIKNVNEKISIIIKKILKLSVEQQKKELEKIAPELLIEKKEIKLRTLPDLKNAKKGKVKMRFEPSPSGPLHIGHAFTLSLNSEFCRKYNGILQIRIADTNPENIYAKSYEMITEDAKWVTKNNVKEIVIQSDRMESYYKVAEELLKKGYAYVCTCRAEEFRELIKKSKACPCRENSKEENIVRWKKMFNEYKEGEAVVRIRTDIHHKNPAMRDWPALRIKEAEHPRQKKRYRVWPLLNFSVAVDDHQLGITHTVRAKEHIDNEKRQKYIFDYLNWEIPTHLYTGRINFIDMRVSCSKTRPFIDNGTYNGWDDIRLPFLAALRRRGYSPEAFIKYALEVGLTQNDKTVNREEFFKTLNAFNKDIVDPISNRYFFIDDPVEITIENAPTQKIELNLHPTNKKGGRKFRTGENFFITKHDFNSFKNNELYRLMDCLNFRKIGNKFVFDSLEYWKYKEKGDKITHWLPKNDKLANVGVLMPDNCVRNGFGEASIKNMKIGQICQMERYGFCRLDDIKDNTFIFWYTHN